MKLLIDIKTPAGNHLFSSPYTCLKSISLFSFHKNLNRIKLYFDDENDLITQLSPGDTITIKVEKDS